MQAVDYLVREHELIERGLDLLSNAVIKLDSGETVPVEFIHWVPDFFMNFADACHHAKEEDIFFPALKEKGIPEEGGPIGVLLHEHVLGRDCNRRMREAGEADPYDANLFSEAAKEYVPLLRQHIFKENNVLFKMAENVLDDSEDEKLIKQYAEVEKQRELTELYKKYEADVSNWEKELGAES